MRRFMLAMAHVALASFTGFAQSATPTHAPSHPLQGAWVIETLNGQPPPTNTVLLLAVAADGTYTATVDGKIEERGTIRVDAAKKPMTLDFVISEGSSAGKTQLGLFEKTADGLRFVLAIPGVATRPADFTITTTNEVIVLKKKRS